MNMVYYFAYGSNMNPERLKERKFNIKSMCSGKLNGYKLSFNKITESRLDAGYANIQKQENSIVEGIIYETDDQSIKNLDRYEGVSTGHYYKENLEIESTKEKINCIVYIACSSKIKEGLKPTKMYLEHLLIGKGYLSNEYYNKLVKVETI